jgi:hypothetical protein
MADIRLRRDCIKRMVSTRVAPASFVTLGLAS